MGSDLVGKSVKAWRSLIEYGARRQRRLAALREVEAVRWAGGAPLLAELRLTSAEFAAVVRCAFPSEDLLSPAMRSAGVDPVAFQAQHRGWSRAMFRGCMSCSSRRQCRRDIASARFSENYQRYCPNSTDLDQIIHSRIPQDNASPA